MDQATPGETTVGRARFPLWAQIVAALVLGIALGIAVGPKPFLGNFGTEQLGRLGMLVIRALKTLAVPLVAFVILDSLLRFEIQGRQGVRLIRICLTNVSVAMVIGLTLTNLIEPGVHLRALFAPLLAADAPDLAHGAKPAHLDPVSAFESMIPGSVAGPFVENTVLPAALLALLIGLALRRTRRDHEGLPTAASFDTVRGAVQLIAESLQRALIWVVLLTPFAAFALVARAVSVAGVTALLGLWAFLLTILLGFALHGLVYYPLIAWWRGGKSPRVYLTGARDALVTGIATNSSLATVPVTLRCLTERIGISPTSARLSACLGTNLNNDGIALYEAMAVLAIAQACGMELGLAQQAAVVGASVMAGMGIAGIPEAGLVMLPVVLTAAGMPDVVAAAAVTLVVPVDWILARCRTAMNVLSDMVVAIVLDRDPAAQQRAIPQSGLRTELPSDP